MREFHRAIPISGRVQGVRFRPSAMDQAERLVLRGTALNLRSGDVEIPVEGGQEQIQAFTRWARKGPTLAKVEDLQFTEGPLEGLTGQFIIR